MEDLLDTATALTVLGIIAFAGYTALHALATI